MTKESIMTEMSRRPANARKAETTTVRSVYQALQRACKEVVANAEKLRDLASTDRLSSLRNFLAYQEEVVIHVENAQQNKSTVALFIMDVDDFKKFNSFDGLLDHGSGNVVLRAIGQVLRTALRDGDPAWGYRHGGDEFAALLVGVSAAVAEARARELLTKIRNLDLQYRSKPLPKVTVSMGFAVLPDHGNDVDDLKRAAVMALAIAKKRGGDQVVSAADVHDLLSADFAETTA